MTLPEAAGKGYLRRKTITVPDDLWTAYCRDKGELLHGGGPTPTGEREWTFSAWITYHVRRSKKEGP